MLITLIHFNGVYLGNTSFKNAKFISNFYNLSIIKLSSKNIIPIYKICNINKYLYKKHKIKKSSIIKIKDFNINLNISLNDLLNKLRKITILLNKHIIIRILLKLINRQINKNIIINNFITLMLFHLKSMVIFKYNINKSNNPLIIKVYKDA